MDLLHPVVDDLWGQPCLAYHLQPDLSEATRARLRDLQQAIADSWPAPLHLCPPKALHVTVYALVPVKERFDKEAYWRAIEAPSIALVEDVCAGFEPFELAFIRLKVTTTAIIAVARDESGLVEALRRRVAAVLPPPPGREPLRYDLIHSTLARYRSSAPVPGAAVQAAENLPVEVRAPVSRIRVVRETLFPCLTVDDIASVPLR